MTSEPQPSDPISEAIRQICPPDELYVMHPLTRSSLERDIAQRLQQEGPPPTLAELRAIKHRLLTSVWTTIREQANYLMYGDPPERMIWSPAVERAAMKGSTPEEFRNMSKRCRLDYLSLVEQRLQAYGTGPTTAELEGIKQLVVAIHTDPKSAEYLDKRYAHLDAEPDIYIWTDDIRGEAAKMFTPSELGAMSTYQLAILENLIVLRLAEGTPLTSAERQAIRAQIPGFEAAPVKEITTEDIRREARKVFLADYLDRLSPASRRMLGDMIYDRLEAKNGPLTWDEMCDIRGALIPRLPPEEAAMILPPVPQNWEQTDNPISQAALRVFSPEELKQLTPDQLTDLGGSISELLSQDAVSHDTMLKGIRGITLKLV